MHENEMEATAPDEVLQDDEQPVRKITPEEQAQLDAIVKGAREIYAGSQNPAPNKTSGGGDKKPRTNDVEAAKVCYIKNVKPLAGRGGEVYEYDRETGWTCCTEEMEKKLQNQRKGVSRGSFDVLYKQVRVPSRDRYEAYWERKRNPADATGWSDDWIPFILEPSQILFTDRVVDFADSSRSFDLNDRIIFGPMISVPWYQYSDDDDASGDAEAPRCVEFEEMVARALPDAECRQYFQELMSCVLTPHVLERKQIIFSGPPHTGKSSLATAIACAPGGFKGCTFFPESHLVHNQFGSCGISDRFANISDDSSSVNDDKWVAFMKQYSSGKVTIEPKFGKAENLVPTAKLISTCNHAQRMVDDSGAVKDRLHVITFSNRIANTGYVSQTRFMDTRYWCDPERRAGVVTWLLEGFQRIWARGGKKMPEPATMSQARENLLNQADPIRGVLSDKLRASNTGFLTTSQIIALLPPDPRNQRSAESTLPGYIAMLFPQARKQQKMVGGERKRGYVGLELAPEGSDSLEPSDD